MASLFFRWSRIGVFSAGAVSMVASGCSSNAAVQDAGGSGGDLGTGPDAASASGSSGGGTGSSTGGGTPTPTGSSSGGSGSSGGTVEAGVATEGGGAPPKTGTDGGGEAGVAVEAGGSNGGGSPDGGEVLPDPGSDGDGDSTVGPNYTSQPDLGSRGNPKGKSFQFSMTLANSMIFNGKDSTVDPSKVNATRSINVYVPAQYKDGDPAPVLVIQDGPGEIGQVSNALDNLTISTDPTRKIPAFVAIAVQNGGNDSIGSERGLEYDTMSDRYARFIQMEVLPAVQSNAQVKAAYPNLKFTQDPSGRAALGCSSGAAAAFTMGWFRPDLFSRIIAYSTTLVAQQDPKAPEAKMYPEGAWDYHSKLEVIKNDQSNRPKQLRIFLNANQNDLSQSAPYHEWLMANQLTAAALKARSFHYKFVEGMGVGHCDGSVQSATLADALVWVWRGYQPSGM